MMKAETLKNKTHGQWWYIPTVQEEEGPNVTWCVACCALCIMSGRPSRKEGKTYSSRAQKMMMIMLNVKMLAMPSAKPRIIDSTPSLWS